MKRTVITLPVFGIALAVLLASSLATFAGAGSRQSKSLTVGAQAPEFGLPILKITTDDKGNHSGAVTKEKVELSKLLDQKKIVVLFLSSYT